MKRQEVVELRAVIERLEREEERERDAVQSDRIRLRGVVQEMEVVEAKGR
jgi:hypothetical protein